ncbi:MAG TPA: ester cyclase [Terriglobales bacterium]
MKSRLAVILLLCTSTAFAGTVPKNEAIARRVFEDMFNQGKFEVANEIYAKNFVNHGFSHDIGPQEDQAAARGWKAAIPDLHMTVERVFNDGEFVTVIWRGEGTNTGSGNGLPATGKKVAGRGITVWRIVDGKITEEWSEFDQLRLMQQLGLVPAQ